MYHVYDVMPGLKTRGELFISADHSESDPVRRKQKENFAYQILKTLLSFQVFMPYPLHFWRTPKTVDEVPSPAVQTINPPQTSAPEPSRTNTLGSKDKVNQAHILKVQEKEDVQQYFQNMLTLHGISAKEMQCFKDTMANARITVFNDAANASATQKKEPESLAIRYLGSVSNLNGLGHVPQNFFRAAVNLALQNRYETRHRNQLDFDAMSKDDVFGRPQFENEAQKKQFVFLYNQACKFGVIKNELFHSYLFSKSTSLDLYQAKRDMDSRYRAEQETAERRPELYMDIDLEKMKGEFYIAALNDRSQYKRHIVAMRSLIEIMPMDAIAPNNARLAQSLSGNPSAPDDWTCQIAMARGNRPGASNESEKMLEPEDVVKISRWLNRFLTDGVSNRSNLEGLDEITQEAIAMAGGVKTASSSRDVSPGPAHRSTILHPATQEAIEMMASKRASVILQ